MKIAVISDIHGNLEALNAVLADIANEKAEKIFVCGDLAVAGPDPVQVMDLFMQLQQEKDITFIRGNTDIWLFNEEYHPKNDTMINAINYTKQVLKPEHINFLKNLPDQLLINIGELAVKLVHEEHIGKEQLGKTVDDIIFCGHTHLPVTFKQNNQLLINNGSVGRPFTDIPAASYVILDYPDQTKKDFYFKHKFVEFDKEKTSKKLSTLPFNGAEKLARVMLNPSLRHKLL